jgi:cyclopropane fatty-acyl-phospholipid synthase-like methyltransferase
MKSDWYQPREDLLKGSVSPRYDPIVRLLERLAPGHRVLDIGCNAGLVSLVAARAGACEVTGIDRRSIYLNQAKEMLEHWRGKGFLSPDASVTFVEADLRDRPELIDAHDVFVMIRVIYHLKEKVADLFDRLNDREDAVLIIQGNEARRDKAEAAPGPFGNKLALAENILAFLDDRGFEGRSLGNEIVAGRHRAGTLDLGALGS